MKTPVTHFGVHEDPDTGAKWLLQASGVISGIGLEKKDNPFKILAGRRCTHMIKLESEKPKLYDELSDIRGTEIFKYMSPVPYKPDQRIVHIHTPRLNHALAVNYLQMMQSPTMSLNCPIILAKNTLPWVFMVLNSSNISRYMITGITADNGVFINQMVQLSFGVQGRLFLAGEKVPTYSLGGVVEFTELTDKQVEKILEFKDSDEYRKLGGYLMYKYLRGENA